MAKVKTHTFNGRKYVIEEAGAIDGVSDIPGVPDPFEMLILTGSGLRAFHSAFHEACEVSGMCDDCLHRYDRDDGYPNTWDAARFLWRLIKSGKFKK